MSVKSALRPPYYLLKFAAKFGFKWATYLVRHQLWLASLAKRGPSGGIIPFTGGPELSWQSRGTIIALHGIEGLQKLAPLGAQLEVHESHVIVEVQGLKFRCETGADIRVIDEVFADQNYPLATTEPFVLDFGANIGASALFFAARHDAIVQAYELVPSTAELCQSNVDLNPAYSSTIKVIAAGVGSTSSIMDVVTDPELRSSNSVQKPVNGQGVERAEIRSVREVATKLNTGGRLLVIKIDIEGGEYDLLPAMRDCGLLQQAQEIYLEWHRVEGHNPQKLRDVLEVAGFTLAEQRHPTADVAVIHALDANVKS